MMKEKLYILPLNNKSVDKIIEIVRNSFKAEYLLGSIYRSKGISLFISTELENPFSPYEYRILINKTGEISCFAEFKKYSDYIFLNMIATAPNLQSQGAASQLFISCINQYILEGFKSFYLDVYDTNTNALKWYYKLGFHNISQKWLLEIKRPVKKNIDGNVTNNMRFLNYPQTKALLQTFDFGMLEYTTNEYNNRIGIIAQDLILNNTSQNLDIDIILDIKRKLKKKNIYIFSDYQNIPGSNVLHLIHRLKLDINDYKNSL